jgi:maltose-binding protein MalE
MGSDPSSARAFFYNKDLLAKAGVAGPPKTWDEFVQAGRDQKTMRSARPAADRNSAGRVGHLDVEQRR